MMAERSIGPVTRVGFGFVAQVFEYSGHGGSTDIPAGG
jgi:hypothetical protein